MCVCVRIKKDEIFFNSLSRTPKAPPTLTLSSDTLWNIEGLPPALSTTYWVGLSETRDGRVVTGGAKPTGIYTSTFIKLYSITKKVHVKQNTVKRGRRYKIFNVDTWGTTGEV